MDRNALLTGFRKFCEEAEAAEEPPTVAPPARLRVEDWEVRPAPPAEGRGLIAQHHYARGTSNTCVACHGLYRRQDGQLLGVAWWIPPTRDVAEKVYPDDPRAVLSLSRLVCHPDVPPNGASFLMGRSIRMIRRDPRWKALVTYADTALGHTGAIYKATNWTHDGMTKPKPRWVDGEGMQVSDKAKTYRRQAEMTALGYRKAGYSQKHRFVMYL